MKVTYKLDKKRMLEPVLKSKWFYLTTLIFILIACLLANDYKFIIGFLLFISIPYLFQIILHINYYLNDKDALLEIDYLTKKITHFKKKQKTEINFEDIEKIVNFKSSRYNDPFGKYTIPSNFYSYTVITDKNKIKIKFSDFILNDFRLSQIKKKVIITPFLNLISK